MPPTFLLADPALAVVRTRVHALPRQQRTRAGLKARWIVLATFALAVAGGLGFLGTWPPLATVMSASMAPTIDTGDMVVLQRLGAPAQVGDVVSIPVPEDVRSRYGYPPVVIHRVVAIAPDGTVTTQGDAHEKPDPFTVQRATLTTKVVATVPAAGQALGFLGSGLGLVWLLSGGALFIAMPLVERYRASQRRGEDLHDGLRSVTEELIALRAEREEERRAHDAALREAAAAQAQLRVVTTTLTEQLARLSAQIERAVAQAAVAPPPPPPPVPAQRFKPTASPLSACVPASRFQRPAPATPDLIAVLAPRAASAWDAPPSGVLSAV
jgi:signal peptidase I